MALEREKIRTHPNFKSFDKKVTDATGIYDEIGFMIYDDMNNMERYILISEEEHREKEDIDDKELRSIEIDLEKIDRLYYINSSEEDNDITVKLIARMRYGTEGDYPLYIELECRYNVLDYASCGVITISKNAELFMKGIEQPQKNILYQSLIDDGVF